MGYHDAPSSTECILGSLDGLSDRTDLVDLEEKGVARLEFDGLLDECGLVTVKSSPTIWKSDVLKSSSRPPSHPQRKDLRCETMGYFLAKILYSSASCS